MADISYYTVEYRVHVASFYIASDQTRHVMKLVRNILRAKYDIEAPEHRVIKVWSNKLLETSSLFDRPRSGRPTERGDAIDDVEKGVNNDPKSSVRRLSNELDISKSTVRFILKKHFGLHAWKHTNV